MASNPVFEALGNATTVNNPNSSRFGKFIRLRFEGGKVQRLADRHLPAREVEALVAAGRRAQLPSLLPDPRRRGGRHVGRSLAAA